MATRARTGQVAHRPRPRARAAKGEGERLRNEILAATEKLLLRSGDVDEVSIRAIASAVGVTPPSIYMHFPDKDALILAVCQSQFVRLEETLAAAIEDIDDPLERLRVMGEEYVRFGVNHPEQYRILLMTKGTFSREDFETGRAPGATAFLLLASAVSACMESGALRQGDAFLVATGLWAVVHGVTSLKISVPDFPYGGDDLLGHVLDVHQRGLA